MQSSQAVIATAKHCKTHAPKQRPSAVSIELPDQVEAVPPEVDVNQDDGRLSRFDTPQPVGDRARNADDGYPLAQAAVTAAI